MTLFPVSPLPASVLTAFEWMEFDALEVEPELRLAPYAATAAATLSPLPNKCILDAEATDE